MPTRNEIEPEPTTLPCVIQFTSAEIDQFERAWHLLGQLDTAGVDERLHAIVNFAWATSGYISGRDSAPMLQASLDQICP